jgi:diguanylate cyclase (GGDEF)-like protein
MIDLSYRPDITRWHDLLGIAADLAFETDASGRFVVLSHELLGRASETLLAEPGDNPFRADQRLRQRRCWLKQADGSVCRMSLSVAPLLSPDGVLTGTRGVAWDVTDQERIETASARMTRRSELIDRIHEHLRTEPMPSRMMTKALHTLAGALGADGAIMLDAVAAGALLSQSGADVPALREAAAARLADGTAGPVALRTPHGHIALFCATPTRFGGCPGVVVWREPGRHGWDADEVSLLAASLDALATVLEHGAVQREVARQVCTDMLTGLPNRHAFNEELGRRLDRLERDGLPGSMMYVDIDRFARFNQRQGHELGDAELRAVATMMRNATRPGDLVARVGGDAFAVWLDGMDHLAAAERAELVCRQALGALRGVGGQPGSLSIGIAGRWPGSDLDGGALLERARRAMALVKQAGGGRWRVWQAGDDAAA